jgi:hypothetical protein
MRNIRARSKAKSKANTNSSPSIQKTPASNLNDFADIDTNYFEQELHNSKGDLAKTQKLIEEMKQYFEGLNMPHGHLNIGRSVRKNSSQINEAINHLLRIVSTYQAGKDMNIPNSNIHIDSNENSRQFIEETCRFEREMFNIHFSHCSTCHRRKINLHVNSNGVCSRCSKEKKGHNKFGHENSALPLWIDKDGNKHFELPKVLLDLQLAECLLIQQVSPFIPVIHIRNGSIGSRGHVVSFYQDITSVCTIFPRLPSEVTMVKVVRSSTTRNEDVIQKAFTVNKHRVLAALLWLKEHNSHYSHIKIDKTRFGWMQGRHECNLDNIIEIDSPVTEPEDNDR